MGTQLATVAMVNERLDNSSAIDSTLIGRILDGVSLQIARHCGRFLKGKNLLLRQTDFVEDTHGDGSWLLCASLWPIETISIVYAADRVFASGTTYAQDTDYRFDSENGSIFFQSGAWPAGRNSIRLTITGGYVDPASTPTGVQQALPADVIEACIQQAISVYTNRRRYGQKSTVSPDGQMERFDDRDLLPSVKGMLRPYMNTKCLVY